MKAIVAKVTDFIDDLMTDFVVLFGDEYDISELLYFHKILDRHVSLIIRKNKFYYCSKRFVLTLINIRDKDIEYILSKNDHSMMGYLASNPFLTKKEYIDKLISTGDEDIFQKLSENVNIHPEHVSFLINHKPKKPNSRSLLFSVCANCRLNSDHVNMVLAKNEDYAIFKMVKNKNVSLTDEQILLLLSKKVSCSVSSIVIRLLNSKKSY